MLRIFRKNKKSPGAVQDVQLRPAEQSGQDPLEQRLQDTRRQLGKRLKMRYIPDILFRYDHSLDYGSKIDTLLDQLKNTYELDTPEK